jgi:hypothetical protein
MSLEDDVAAGLLALNATRQEPLSLDAEGACEITLRIPPTVVKLSGEKLVIRLEVAKTGRSLTLRAPIASTARELPVEVLDAMVSDQLTAARVGGASYTYEPEIGVIFAVYHWIVPSITPEQLGELIRAFSGAAFRALERMGTIARRVPGITTINDAEIKR